MQNCQKDTGRCVGGITVTMDTMYFLFGDCAMRGAGQDRRRFFYCDMF